VGETLTLEEPDGATELVLVAEVLVLVEFVDVWSLVALPLVHALRANVSRVRVEPRIVMCRFSRWIWSNAM